MIHYIKYRYKVILLILFLILVSFILNQFNYSNLSFLDPEAENIISFVNSIQELFNINQYNFKYYLIGFVDLFVIVLFEIFTLGKKKL